MSLRAVIYARYSSENQRDASIEDQVRICKERIGREGWELVQVFRDQARSGATSLRGGYQALLTAAREGAFEVVVAEALDRLSRDQEDVAALFKRLSFENISIVTLAEGEINELHVGLKGTMNALFLKDLAAKTHRGVRGRVENGRSGGGNAFGYRVVRSLGADGQPVTGERSIERAEATTVERIFRCYAAGQSPKSIALKLNAESVAGPRGAVWSASTINGNRARGTGILNNELYIGRRIWNRLTYAKDPETGRRRSRQRSANELVRSDVPELRIISDELWGAVKGRQAGLDRRGAAGDTDVPAPYWSKQRPRYLFSGLMRCGVCGGGFSKVSAQHFGCSSARNNGPTVCGNQHTIRRDVLEETVLGAVRERLMDPTLYKAFADEFTAEWNRLQGASAAEHGARENERRRVQQQIDRLVEAIADGTPASVVNDRLRKLEARRTALDGEIASATAPAPRLHPNLAEVYRQRVTELAEALSSDDAAEARELVRGLIDHITLMPEGTSQRVEVRGELAAILGLGQAGRGAGSGIVLAEQVKMVAGTGYHLNRTQISYRPGAGGGRPERTAARRT